MDDAFGEFRFTEIAAHRFSQRAPEFVPAFFVDGLIPNHGKFMRERCHKNQYPVMLWGISHAKPYEFLLCFGYGVFDMLVADVHTNFA